MNSKKNENLLIVGGLLFMLVTLLNSYFQFSSKMDETYLISVGVMFISSGTIMINKKPL